MEKEPQPESMATVTIKPEYAPSEVYGSEPPPVSVTRFLGVVYYTGRYSDVVRLK
nr:unnamed protein product [Callosobruchus analis]